MYFNMQLTYLRNIFGKLNTLNTSLESDDDNTLQLSDKLKSFIRKTELWKSRMENANSDMFPTLKQFTESRNT